MNLIFRDSDENNNTLDDNDIYCITSKYNNNDNNEKWKFM